MRRIGWLARWYWGALLVCSGCEDGNAGSQGSHTASAAVPVAVFAASSLTEAFQDLQQAFGEAEPGVDLQLTFSGSQVLRLQIEQGAEADVYASADARHMQALKDKRFIGRDEVFAENVPVVIVPTANPAGLETFADLPQAQRLVIGTEAVPIGGYTRTVLKRAQAELGQAFADRVRERVVSEENNVRLVRAKVEMGEADAAIVFRTDAVASSRVKSIAIPEAFSVRAGYHLGLVDRKGVSEARHAAAGRFFAFVTSDAGRAILERHGFRVP